MRLAALVTLRNGRVAEIPTQPDKDPTLCAA